MSKEHGSTEHKVGGTVIKEEAAMNKKMSTTPLDSKAKSPSLGGDVWSPSGNNGLKIGKQLG